MLRTCYRIIAVFLLGIYPFSYSLLWQFPKKTEQLPERKACPRTGAFPYAMNTAVFTVK